MSTKRVAWIDIGKGIAIICVVLGHTISGLDSPLKQAIFTFHMPLFFVYAGLTFRLKPMKDVLSPSFKRLLIPYILLFCISALFVILKADHLSFGLIKKLAISFVFASAVKVKPWGFDAAGMIWFFMVLFIARVVTNPIIGFFSRREVPFAVQLILMLVFSGIGIAISHYTYLPFSLDLVPLACLYLFAGYTVSSRNKIELATSLPSTVLSLVIWIVSMQFCWFSMGDRMFSYAPLAVAGSFAGVILVTKISQCIDKAVRPLSTYLAFMGRNSLLVLAIHYIESRIVAWSSLPLLSAIGNAWFALFFAHFAFITLVILVFMQAPISRSKYQ